MTAMTDRERAARPPRTDVLREAPFALRADDDGGEAGDGLTLDGYGAVFNRETIIDSWEGKFREKISPGAMKKSFRENPPKIQYDHGRHPLIGSIPIASLQRIAEESDPELAPEGGAHVVGRLHDNWLIEPVRDAIASRSIDGMSFRFSVVRERWFDPEGKEIRDEEALREQLRRTWYEDVADEELLLRDLKELRVPEIGPVMWPAYSETSVGVRSTVIDLGRLGDPATKKLLARAVLLADAAETAPRSADEREAPRPTEEAGPERAEPAAGEHAGSEAREETRDEQTPATGDNEPPTTVRDEPPAGTHSVYSGSADWYLPAPEQGLY